MSYRIGILIWSERASSDWQRYLSKIDTDQRRGSKKIFYTALYHTAVARIARRCGWSHLVWTYGYIRPQPIVRFIPYFLYGILFGHYIL
ncbi:MAG: glycoside hydrolase domain-containing protein [Coprobacter sp.]